MHDQIPFFLALRSSVRRFQMPFEGLKFVKTLVKFELFTQQYGAFLRTKYRTSIHQCFVKLIQILT